MSDSPWEKFGLRDDGYWVADPRDFRITPEELTDRKAITERLRKNLIQSIRGPAGAQILPEELKRMMQLKGKE